MATTLDVGRVHGAADRGRGDRHPLRHPLVEARHLVAGGLARHAARPRRDRRRLLDGALVRRLHHQRADGGPARRHGLGRVRVRRRPARSRARRSGAAARAAPVLLEERQVGAGPHPDGRRTSRDSGSRTATTCTATPGPKSATGDRRRLADGAGRRGRRGDADGARAPRRRCPAGRATTRGSMSTSGSRPRTATRRCGRTRWAPTAPARRSSSRSTRSPTARSRPTSCATFCPGDELEVKGPLGGYFVWRRRGSGAGAAHRGRIGDRAADGDGASEDGCRHRRPVSPPVFGAHA